MQLINDTMTFQPKTGAPVPSAKTYSFPHAVIQSAVALKGFTAEYSNGNDHDLGRLEVDVSVETVSGNPKQVQVLVTFGLRDYSGNWDDAYQGQVDYCLFVQTVAIPRATGVIG